MADGTVRAEPVEASKGGARRRAAIPQRSHLRTEDFIFVPRRYPTTPGCYLMKSAGGKVIYVGKAKDLRKRLSSYFRDDASRRQLVRSIASIEVILVNTETESLILEDTLIKRLQPRFNRARRDEEDGYYYIAQTQEPVPRLVPFRKHRLNGPLKSLRHLGDGATTHTYGPYVSRRLRDALLKFVRETFRVRSCDALPARACFLYELDRCSAPCEGRVSPKGYDALVRDAGAFLARGPARILPDLRRRMQAHADALEFEHASRYRDLVDVLESTLGAQLVERPVTHDQDVMYVGETHALTMRYERGALIEVRTAPLDGTLGPDEARLSLILARYAHGARPAELIVNALAAPPAVRAKLLQSGGTPIKITIPTRGEAAALVRLAELNYRYRAQHSLW